jgi:hypothetical protein
VQATKSQSTIDLRKQRPTELVPLLRAGNILLSILLDVRNEHLNMIRKQATAKKQNEEHTDKSTIMFGGAVEVAALSVAPVNLVKVELHCILFWLEVDVGAQRRLQIRDSVKARCSDTNDALGCFQDAYGPRLNV